MTPRRPHVQAGRMARFGGAVAVALCSGCAVGPNYIRPAMPAPSAWKSANPPIGPNEAAPPSDRWWEMYKDPTLDRLESLTVADNQQVHAAMDRVIESRALARAALSPLFPTLSFNPDLEWKGGRLLRSLDPQRRGNLNDLRVPLELDYSIDLWGRTRRRYESLRARAEADAESSRAILLALEAEVARDYFQLCSLDAELEILDRNVKMRADAVAWTQGRVKAGFAGGIDVKKAQGELASAQAKKFDIERRRARVSNALAVLSGQLAADFSIPTARLGLSPPSIPQKLSPEILRRRPDVAEAERMMASKNAEIGVAKAAYFPQMQLTGAVGYESNALRTLFDWQSRAGSIGPSISFPLFNAGLSAANLKASRAAYDEAMGHYKQKVLVAFGEIENALAEMRSHASAAQRLHEATEAARAGADLAGIRFKQGQVSYLEVLDGQRSLLVNELVEQQNVLDRFLASVLMVEALGGGWPPPALDIPESPTAPAVVPRSEPSRPRQP